jgi:excisionase family DNA binding protein
MVATTPIPIERLLTPREVAVALSISIYTVRRMTRDGTLPSIRLNSKTIRYPADLLDELLSLAWLPFGLLIDATLGDRWATHYFIATLAAAIIVAVYTVGKQHGRRQH